MGVQFRWYSGDSDNVPAPPQPPVHRKRRGRLPAALAFIALLIVGVVYWQSQRGLSAARADLQRVVDWEIEALRTGKQEAFLSLLDDRYGPWIRYHEENFGQVSAWYAARPGVRAHLERLTLKPDLAVVQVRLRNERGAQTEPVEWFYRRVNGQWRHAPPHNADWSSPVRIETAHITIEVPPVDEAAANRLAPELEKLWCDLIAAYAPERGNSGAGRSLLRIIPYGRSLVSNAVPSPHLALDLWSPHERFARLQREARLIIARSALAGAVRTKRSTTRSDWLLESLALWHAGGLPSEWRACIGQCIDSGTYRDVLGQTAAGDEPQALPKAGSQAYPLLYALGEFLGVSYPPQQLRDLLIAVDSADSRWDAIQTVLGLDAAALTAAWEAYLQEHYSTS